MKKLLCSFVSIVMLISLTACSKGPVPFTEKLFNNRECYIDVLEITPQSSIDDVVFLYCECKLVDGSSVWMEIFEDEYITYFDSEADEYDVRKPARKVVYDEAVRLNGKAKNIKNIIDDSGEKKIKVFSFESANADITLKTGTRTLPAIPYDKETKDNTVVYTDIVRIESKYATSSSSLGIADSVVCQCETDKGDEVWLLILMDDYKEYLDASASFKADYIDPHNAEVLDFVEPVRLFGLTTKSAEHFSVTVQGAEIPAQIIDFIETDKEQVEAAKLSNQQAVPYSGDEKINQNVYIDITHITPRYTLSRLNLPLATEMICECKTVTGKTEWIKLGIATYEKNFFDDYADNMQVEKKLTQTKRVVGKIQKADDVAMALSTQIKRDTIITVVEVKSAQ